MVMDQWVIFLSFEGFEEEIWYRNRIDHELIVMCLQNQYKMDPLEQELKEELSMQIQRDTKKSNLFIITI